MATIPEALALAVAHHQAGRLQAAEQIYYQILQADPGNSEALHLRGLLAYQAGRYQQAVDSIQKALAQNPNQAAFVCNLGMVHLALRRWDEASACCRRALQLQPDFPEAHNNLGIALAEQGRRDEAAACYREALRLRPQYPEALANLGAALKEQGRLDESVACYGEVRRLRPDSPEAHLNLGLAVAAKGRLEEAVGCWREALRLRPEYPEALNNLANVWQGQGQFAEAAAAYRQALRLRPDYAEAHNNLGVALEEQGQLDEAIACYRQALRLRSDYPAAHYHLGKALGLAGQLDEAIASCRQALGLLPDRPEAPPRQPDFAAALGRLILHMQQACLWQDLRDLSRRAIEALERGVTRGNADPLSPFGLLVLATPPSTPAQQRECARQWVDHSLKSLSHDGRGLALARPRRAGARIRVGYLSGDFHEHATARLIVELFEKHNRERVEVLGYSYGPDDGSALRRRLVQAFDRFVDLRGVSFGDAAQRIATDGVDILVDLKGYTRGARPQILALRPAPIQAHYLGYPGTMAAPFIDYLVVDDFVVPPEQQRFFAEKLVYLPGCYQVNDSRRQVSALTPTRSACRLPESGFVFCCFNNSYKIAPEMFDVWMGLLRSVPGSVLWLLEGNRWAAANLRREAQARGVAAERLVFAPPLPPPEHLARHRLADLFLDTFPVNAHTTASDALWAGCPVLTLAGETFESRVAGSLLRALDLPELITNSVEQYQSMALRLAEDKDLRAQLRARLEAGRLTSPLFDAARFARNLEKAYETMWEIHVSGGQPRGFAVTG